MAPDQSRKPLDKEFKMKILAFIAFIIISLPLVALNGWALHILWGWFIVPVFALPMLEVPQAIGISVVVSFLTVTIKPMDNDDEYYPTLIKGVLTGFFKPLVFLATGFLYLSIFF